MLFTFGQAARNMDPVIGPRQAVHLGLFTPIQTRRERERRKRGGRETEKRRLTKGD